jgi:large subunit ribosomal protein L3
VPGAKGGWITVRDAVKKALPEGVPKPGKFKLAEGAGADTSKPAPEAAGTAADQATEAGA